MGKGSAGGPHRPLLQTPEATGGPTAQEGLAARLLPCRPVWRKTLPRVTPLPPGEHPQARRESGGTVKEKERKSLWIKNIQENIEGEIKTLQDREHRRGFTNPAGPRGMLRGIPQVKAKERLPAWRDVRAQGPAGAGTKQKEKRALSQKATKPQDEHQERRKDTRSSEKINRVIEECPCLSIKTLDVNVVDFPVERYRQVEGIICCP